MSVFTQGDSGVKQLKRDKFCRICGIEFVNHPTGDRIVNIGGGYYAGQSCVERNRVEITKTIQAAELEGTHSNSVNHVCPRCGNWSDGPLWSILHDLGKGYCKACYVKIADPALNYIPRDEGRRIVMPNHPKSSKPAPEPEPAEDGEIPF